MVNPLFSGHTSQGAVKMIIFGDYITFLKYTKDYVYPTKYGGAWHVNTNIHNSLFIHVVASRSLHSSIQLYFTSSTLTENHRNKF